MAWTYYLLRQFSQISARRKIIFFGINKEEEKIIIVLYIIYLCTKKLVEINLKLILEKLI